MLPKMIGPDSYAETNSLFQTGMHAVSGGVREATAFSRVDFYSRFETDDIAVFSQVQTFNDPHYVKTRQQPSDAAGFSVALEQEGSATSNLHLHGQELVGWFAIPVGTGTLGGLRYQSGITPTQVGDELYLVPYQHSFASVPRIFASIRTWAGHDSCGLRLGPEGSTCTGFSIKVEEESCHDEEIEHPNPESVSYFALSGFTKATDTNLESQHVLIQGKPTAHSALSRAQSVIAETGTVTSRYTLNVEDSWVSTVLDGAYFAPVLLGGVPSQSGSDEAVVRFRNLHIGRRGIDAPDTVGKWIFETRVQEPPCRDDRHAAEIVPWMVVESGVFFSDSGTMLQSGAIIAAGAESFKQVNFNSGGFPSSALYA
eukprot:SAG31_NODE_8157_length_1507_cov_1.041903_1_plen_369_part_10